MERFVAILFIFCVYCESSYQQDVTRSQKPLDLASFGEKIYHYLASKSSQNFVFSPISLIAPLYLLSLAAKQGSKTQQELFSFLAPQQQSISLVDTHLIQKKIEA